MTDKAGTGDVPALHARPGPGRGDLSPSPALEAGRQPLPETVTVTGTLDGKAFVRDRAGQGRRGRRPTICRGPGPSWRSTACWPRTPRSTRQAIVALSKAMYVMTPFTSLLVLENEEMYKQYKVDRGRKDHWAMYPAPEKIKVVYEPTAGDAGRTEGDSSSQALSAEDVLGDDPGGLLSAATRGPRGGPATGGDVWRPVLRRLRRADVRVAGGRDGQGPGVQLLAELPSRRRRREQAAGGFHHGKHHVGCPRGQDDH